MIERTIRKLKREKLAFEKAGLQEEAQDVNVRIRRLNGLYKDFSKSANLPEQRERLRVQFTDSKSEEKAAKLLEKRNAEEPIRQAIKQGDYPLKINADKQARHMEGTEKPGRSVVTVPLEELQSIIDQNAGNGKIVFAKDGSFRWTSKEIIGANKCIGFTINKNGDKIEAWRLKIHYSKTGTHAVPFPGRWKK